jgi:phage baseplate assembly protein W
MTVDIREPRGWPLLPAPDAQGQIAWPSLEESVRDQIQVILSTRPGEQLMRPRYGGGLQVFLDQPNTLATRRRIRDQVEQSLGRWEDRILLDRVDVDEVPGRPTFVRVAVHWRLRRTGQPATTSLTLELERR